jgi:hypothetical protein
MARFEGFLGPTYQGRAQAADAERSINFFLEKAGSEGAAGKSPAILLSRPGLATFAQLGTLPPPPPPPPPPPIITKTILTVIGSYVPPTGGNGYFVHLAGADFPIFASNEPPIFPNTPSTPRALNADITAASIFNPAAGTAAEIAALNLDFYINPDPGGVGFGYFYIYEVYVTTYDGSTPTGIWRPTATNWVPVLTGGTFGTPQDSGILTNPQNAIDGNTATYAEIQAGPWGDLTNPSQLFVSGFVLEATVPGIPPSISSFTASPATIASGNSSTLGWAVSGAQNLSISAGVGPVIGSSVSVSPTDGTTYRLTASNAAGSVTMDVTVAVTGAPGPPVVSSFAASPAEITLGGSTTLSWVVTGSTSVSINNGVGAVAASGSTTVSPGSTANYVLTAVSSSGGTATANAAVTVLPKASLPLISSFTASPASITAGGSSLLAWRVNGATSLAINQSVGDVTALASIDVSPSATITYQLTATNAAGSVTANATVSVAGGAAPPVIGSFTATPATIQSGETVTLAWSGVTGAVDLSINSGVGDVTGLLSIAVTPAISTEYVLTATSSGGSTASKNILVVVATAGGLRTMGPEPGLQFGRVAAGSGLTNSQFGDTVAGLSSTWSGVAGLVSPVPFMKSLDFIFPDWTDTGNDTANSGQYLPSSLVSPYFITCNGGLFAKFSVNPTYNVLNIADPNLQKALLDPVTGWFVSYLSKYGPNHSTGTPVDAAHPTTWTLDGYSSNFSALLNPNGGTFVPDAPYPQNRAAWYAAWNAFYLYAVEHCPMIRFAPHIGSLEDASLGTFQSIYQNCPMLMKEPFFINNLGNRAGLVLQILNLYWFANLAPRLFANDPATRVVLFGCWADKLVGGTIVGQDYHSSLALYLLARGPNTFFDLLTTVGSQQPVDPSIWLPTAGHLGQSVSAPVLLSGSGATSFYRRDYPHGTAYFNFDTATHTATPPAGSTDWLGNPVTLVTLTNGTGEVVWGP